jgi:queuine tRNA-ribosyltransferase
MRSALEWEVVAKQGMARAGKLVLKHGEVLTPVFMPVGTLASIKGLTSQQVENIGYRLILGNTYHLALRPGADVIEGLGGIHEFMDWKQ